MTVAVPQGLSARQGPGTEMGQTSGDWGAEQVAKAGPLWSRGRDSALHVGSASCVPVPLALGTAAVQWTLSI